MLKENFTIVFRENRWGNAESLSGAGSTLSSESVLHSVQALDDLIRRFNIRSISDVPCGDFYWIPLLLGRFPKLEYTGFDIVTDLIELNRQKFPDRNFQCLDITESTLPQSDLIFCKDLFLHLPHSSCMHALRNFKVSGSRFMLITSVAGADNQELIIGEPGAFRHVDFRIAPFSLPTPIWSSNYLSLWSLDALPMSLFDELCAKFPD
jgi:hypothetical protein